VLSLLLVTLVASTAEAKGTPKVTIKASPQRASLGQPVTLSGEVRNAARGFRNLIIQRRIGSTWRRLRTVTLNASHAYGATVKVTSRGRWVLRAKYVVSGQTRYSPTSAVSVAALATPGPWIATAGSYGDSFALRADGSLWASGDNQYGQLGVGDMKLRRQLTRVGTDTDWASIGTGWMFSVALKSDGSLWAWGFNGHGQLGLGDDQ
jgi:hypothetical protein